MNKLVDIRMCNALLVSPDFYLFDLIMSRSLTNVIQEACARRLCTCEFINCAQHLIVGAICEFALGFVYLRLAT